jgi:MFS family permease
MGSTNGCSVNQMIFDIGQVPEARVGFYAGLIESIFSVVAMFSTIPWGRLADRIGRKPVLVFSIIGLSICTALFGLSQNLLQMFLTRCSAGLFAGSVVTIRTMMAENSTPKTQARVFSYFAFASNVGIFLGPVLGGALADPAREYGGVFKRVYFFREYPYALATCFIGIFGLLSALFVLFFVKETLKTKIPEARLNGSTQSEEMSISELVKCPGVARVLFLQCHIMVLAFSFTAVMPVFYFTSVKKGGYGFDPFWISVFMALGGLAQAMWMLIVFPWIQRRWSTGTVIRLCARAYPFFFAILPIYNAILRKGWTTFFWVTAPVMSMIGAGVAMCFTAIQLAINDVNPKPATLGTLNSVALALTSGIRSFSPALFTTLFAIGVDNHILAGYFVWVIMILIAIGFTFDAQLLPANAEGRLDKQESTEGPEP